MGIDVPKIEIRFEQLSVEGDAFVGSRALPTLLNSTINSVEVFFHADQIVDIVFVTCLFNCLLSFYVILTHSDK